MTKGKGKMSVKEAGHLGGIKGGERGGDTTSGKHGRDFYEEIGHKGGQKVKELVKKGIKSKQ